MTVVADDVRLLTMESLPLTGSDKSAQGGDENLAGTQQHIEFPVAETVGGSCIMTHQQTDGSQIATSQTNLNLESVRWCCITT
eukprot:10301947-Karenia_brevis.AAC.1